MSIISKLREFDRQPGRVKKGWYVIYKSGYVLDRRLFLAWAFLSLCLCAGYAYDYYNASTHFHIFCPGDSPCTNPFFNNCPYEVPQLFCEMEYLPPGTELGSKPSFLVSNIGSLTVASLFGVIFINHFVNNKGWRFEDVSGKS